MSQEVSLPARQCDCLSHHFLGIVCFVQSLTPVSLASSPGAQGCLQDSHLFCLASCHLFLVQILPW